VLHLVHHKGFMQYLLQRKNIYFILLNAFACSLVWNITDGQSLFYLICSKILITLCVFFVMDKQLLQKLKNVFQQPMVWACIGVFLWYGIWIYFAADKTAITNTFDRKLSFLIMPIIMAGEQSLSKRKIERIVFSLVLSCLVAMIYCEALGIYSYNLSKPHNKHFLFYELLAAPIMHPGYLSNFFVGAIIWLSLPYCGYPVKYSLPSWVRICLLVLFIVFIGFLTSKTAFIILFFYATWFLLKLFRSKLSQQQKMIAGGFAIASVCVFFIIVKTFFWFRFSEAFTLKPITNQVGFSESIMSRAAAAKEAFAKVKPVWYKGYGTGMANAMLEEQLKEKGYVDLVKFHMHPHNQFMRTWLDVGLFGLLYIIAVFVALWWYFKKNNEWFGAWMVILLLINCITDDMLEIQAGLLFFLFFICLMRWANRNDYQSGY
jgi:O-antigen ligase